MVRVRGHPLFFGGRSIRLLRWVFGQEEWNGHPLGPFFGSPGRQDSHIGRVHFLRDYESCDGLDGLRYGDSGADHYLSADIFDLPEKPPYHQPFGEMEDKQSDDGNFYYPSLHEYKRITIFRG